MNTIFNQIKTSVQTFIKNEEGAALVEYSLLIALVAVASITAVTLVGTDVGKVFKKTTDALALIAP